MKKKKKMKMMNFNKTFKVKQFARFYCNEVKLITKENLAKKIDSKSDYYLLVKNKKKKILSLIINFPITSSFPSFKPFFFSIFNSPLSFFYKKKTEKKRM